MEVGPGCARREEVRLQEGPAGRGVNPSVAPPECEITPLPDAGLGLRVGRDGARMAARCPVRFPELAQSPETRREDRARCASTPWSSACAQHRAPLPAPVASVHPAAQPPVQPSAPRDSRPALSGLEREFTPRTDCSEPPLLEAFIVEKQETMTRKTKHLLKSPEILLPDQHMLCFLFLVCATFHIVFQLFLCALTKWRSFGV